MPSRNTTSTIQILADGVKDTVGLQFLVWNYSPMAEIEGKRYPVFMATFTCSGISVTQEAGQREMRAPLHQISLTAAVLTKI